MAKRQKNETGNSIKIIHTVPEMDDIDREKSGKDVGSELYEIFSRIQSQLKADNENPNI